ncbi:MAG TPA: hypothetical protein PL072_01800 [Phycisphaerales bacterium]|nr:hypothetical protein [Phycisphaerales bacterium]
MPESAASPNAISWAALLAHWTQVAQASLALPRDAEGDRWRAAVPSIIMLQAVTHALAEVAGFAYAQRDERALAQDKSELLIKEHAGALHALWKTEPLPDLLREMIDDARTVQRRTHEGGLEWRLKDKDAKGRAIEHAELEHPAELAAALVSLDLSDAAGGGAGPSSTGAGGVGGSGSGGGRGFRGDLFLAAPGVSVMPGSPIAFVRERRGGPPSPAVVALVTEFVSASAPCEKPELVPTLRQVYRQFDFGTGQVRRDLVVPSDAPLTPGQPLLVPAIEHGREVAVTLPPPPGALDRLKGVRVEFESTDDEALV